MEGRILIPLRYAAWLSGDMGTTLTNLLATSLSGLTDCCIARLPRGLLVQADEAEGPLVEAVHRAVLDMDQNIALQYPIFYREMGPVWTGTLQVLFPPHAHAPA